MYRLSTSTRRSKTTGCQNGLAAEEDGGTLGLLTGASLFRGRPQRLGASASWHLESVTGGAMHGGSNGRAATGIGAEAVPQLATGGNALAGCNEQVTIGFVLTASSKGGRKGP